MQATARAALRGVSQNPQIRTISFICSSVIGPLTGTPKQFGVFLGECFFPIYDCSDVSSLSLELLRVLFLC